MSRLSFALLVVTGLMLTAYFGAEAYRAHNAEGEVELGDAAAYSPPFSSSGSIAPLAAGHATGSRVERAQSSVARS